MSRSHVVEASNSAMHCFLTGYRGCGKSSVGQSLAKRLNRPFLDTDRLIERETGLCIAEIFLNEGEQAFRDLESQLLEKIRSVPSSVIATGGGMILRSENRASMRQLGIVVWLQASPEELWRRIQSDVNSPSSRPALTALSGLEEVRHVLEKRTPYYHETADYIVSTEARELEAIVDEIVRDIRQLPTRFSTSEPHDVRKP